MYLMITNVEDRKCMEWPLLKRSAGEMLFVKAAAFFDQ
jgi:hypothetical protein